MPRSLTRVYTTAECAPICGFRHPDRSANGVSTIETHCKTHLGVAMCRTANVMPLVALGTRARARNHVCKSAAHHMLHAGATLDEAASNSDIYVSIRYVYCEKALPTYLYASPHTTLTLRSVRFRKPIVKLRYSRFAMALFRYPKHSSKLFEYTCMYLRLFQIVCVKGRKPTIVPKMKLLISCQ